MSQPNSRCQVLTTSEAYYVRLLNPAKKKTEHRGERVAVAEAVGAAAVGQEAVDLGDSADPVDPVDPVAEGAEARMSKACR